MAQGKSILEVKNLSVSHVHEGQRLLTIQDVNFTLYRGQMTAVVGESGSGKSVTALSLLKLIRDPGKIESGQVLYWKDDKKPLDLMALSEGELRSVRGKRVAMIFQEPLSSLNPVYTIGEQIVETLQAHSDITTRDAKMKACQLLERVGISDANFRFNQYPHELSGGLRQRAMIAMALSCDPEIIIADEPTTALDVTIQAQIMELLDDLMKERGLAVLLITHDLGIVASYASEVVVMYAGEIIETGCTKDIFKNPKHPYTQGLLRSIPAVDSDGSRLLYMISGSVPQMSQRALGCRFAPRCPDKRESCAVAPLAMTYEKGRSYRCLYPCQPTSMPKGNTL